jgi:hypothetical protein
MTDPLEAVLKMITDMADSEDAKGVSKIDPKGVVIMKKEVSPISMTSDPDDDDDLDELFGKGIDDMDDSDMHKMAMDHDVDPDFIQSSGRDLSDFLKELVNKGR